MCVCVCECMNVYICTLSDNTFENCVYIFRCMYCV